MSLNNQEFTVVEKRSGKNANKNKCCHFCRKNKDPSWINHDLKECQNITCFFCKEHGHLKAHCKKLKEKIRKDVERQDREARIAAELECNYCKEPGHLKAHCKKLKEKIRRETEKKQKMDQDFPATIGGVVPKNSENFNLVKKSGWVEVAKVNRDETIVSTIEKVNTQQEKAKKEANEKHKKEEHVKYLQRHAKYLQRLEFRKKKEEAYVNNMRERFGSHWFNYVNEIEDGKYDSRLASDMRYEWEEEQIRKEEEWDKHVARVDREISEKMEKREKEEEEKRQILSPQAFNNWRFNRDMEESDEIDDWLEESSINWMQN